MLPNETFFGKLDKLQWEISDLTDSFHVSCFLPDGTAIGSGFHASECTARKIARVELAERLIAGGLSKNKHTAHAWRLNDDDSGSGFAAGYMESRTIIRSLAEACERWALSKWIDDAFSLIPCPDIIADTFVSKVRGMFSNCSLYSIEIPLLIGNRILKFHVAVVLGWTNSGVFAGYGSNLNLSEALRHAYVEAYRNFSIFKNQTFNPYFPYNRIWYFGNHKAEAEKLLTRSTHSKWPSPKLSFLKVDKFEELYLARAILKNWIPWQNGPASRFLY